MNLEGQQRMRGHLESFVNLASPRGMSRAWISTEDARIYVRHAAHWIENKDGGRIVETLDIANVEVAQKRQGTWSFLLKTAQEICPWDAVYIENVHSPILRDYIKKLALGDPRWMPAGFNSFAWIKVCRESYK